MTRCSTTRAGSIGCSTRTRRAASGSPGWSGSPRATQFERREAAGGAERGRGPVTTETEIKEITSAMGELAKAVEELAGVVESIARGRTELSLAASAAD